MEGWLPLRRHFSDFEPRLGGRWAEEIPSGKTGTAAARTGALGFDHDVRRPASCYKSVRIKLETTIPLPIPVARETNALHNSFWLASS